MEERMEEKQAQQAAETPKRGLKKNDKILIGLILGVALSAFLLHMALKDTGSGVVTVKVDGVIQGQYKLNEDKRITINDGTNILEIQNGKAKMTEADCPDQLCVHQKAISADRENIICLPNRVIAEVESQHKSEIDAITN